MGQRRGRNILGRRKSKQWLMVRNGTSLSWSKRGLEAWRFACRFGTGCWLNCIKPSCLPQGIWGIVSWFRAFLWLKPNCNHIFCLFFFFFFLFPAGRQALGWGGIETNELNSHLIHGLYSTLTHSLSRETFFSSQRPSISSDKVPQPYHCSCVWEFEFLINFPSNPMVQSNWEPLP